MKFETKNLNEVVFFQEGPGVRKFQFQSEGVKLLNVGNINNGVLNTGTTKLYISEEEAYGKYKHFLVDDGDLLIASSGIVVDNFHNKIAFATAEDLPLCLNTSTIRFKSLNNSISLEYLKFFLKTSNFKNQLKKLITGSAQLNFGPSHLKQIEIPFPILSDQNFITNILCRAENLIIQRKESISLLDEFLKCTFLEMFGDPIRNEKGFGIRNLSEFYINPKDGTKCGPFGSALKKEELTDFGIPVWTMYNILKDGQFVFDGCLWISEKKYEELKNYNTKNGDIIISRAGTVGKMCIIKTNYTSAIISSNLIRLRLGNKLLPIYFLSLMKYFQSKVIKLKQGNEDAYSHMSTGILDKINFPYPPLELQNEFANIVEKTETLKAQYQSSLQELENLYHSLSQQAFKGELNAKDEELLMAAESRAEYKTK